jgi:soluble epoxide hydrolase/lipid-phosphate phosphatase
MDPSQYKDIAVHGVQYHYYHSAPKLASKPTLLFLHGFPSTSVDWVHQVPYFSNKGYGIIAPDMLGYGGTSKPEDPRAYAGPELAAQCIAILDAEGVDKAIIVAHDWYAKQYPQLHESIAEPSFFGTLQG